MQTLPNARDSSRVQPPMTPQQQCRPPNKCTSNNNCKQSMRNHSRVQPVVPQRQQSKQPHTGSTGLHMHINPPPPADPGVVAIPHCLHDN